MVVDLSVWVTWIAAASRGLKVVVPEDASRAEIVVLFEVVVEIVVAVVALSAFDIVVAGAVFVVAVV